MAFPAGLFSPLGVNCTSRWFIVFCMWPFRYFSMESRFPPRWWKVKMNVISNGNGDFCQVIEQFQRRWTNTGSSIVVSWRWWWLDRLWLPPAIFISPMLDPHLHIRWNDWWVKDSNFKDDHNQECWPPSIIHREWLGWEQLAPTGNPISKRWRMGIGRGLECWGGWVFC